ncbi:Uncharacterised protein [Streptococcus pneumoniae]|nr:Uncharacterised protein [Streptococcus pneumoniae]
MLCFPLSSIKNIHPVCKFITCNNVCNTFSNISCKFVASFNNSAISFNASKRRISFSSKFILITNYNYNIKKFLNSINKKRTEFLQPFLYINHFIIVILSNVGSRIFVNKRFYFSCPIKIVHHGYAVNLQ